MPPDAPSSRDDFSPRTKRVIAQRSGYRCAICGCQTESPGFDPNTAVSIGDAAHITAASIRGPRYDRDLTPDERTSAENGLWACKNHHWTIDHDEKGYTVDELVRRKARAEERAQLVAGLEEAHGAELATAIAAAREASERIIEQWRVQYRFNQAGIVELDFREAPTKETSGAVWPLARVAAAAAQGHKLLLAGRPGAGKTITLIQLAARLSAGTAGPVPLILSVNGWVAAHRDLASHVIAHLTTNGVSADAAALLLATGRLAILLNGWNEAAEAEQARASELLNDFQLNHSLTGLVLTTRATRHAPAMVGETVLEVLPLTAAKRESIVRAANLTDPNALLQQIAQNRILAEVTETPLFLAAAIKLARAGRAIPASRAGLLECFLADLQDTDNHAVRLRTGPCQDCHYRYQIDLAAEMTREGLTVLPTDQVQAIIGATSTALIAAGRIGQAGAASAIAESLAQHHALVYLPVGGLGYSFLHQQFQEWFASRWLLEEIRRLSTRPEGSQIYRLQRDFLNKPAWTEAINFVIESLVAGRATETATALVRWMMPVDMIRAAELSQMAGASVWAAVRDDLTRALRRWHEMGGPHRDCALTAMLATGQPDFADLIWPQLEAGDQSMFHLCRLHEPFRIAVLGPSAIDRLARCPERLETMFLREISSASAEDEIAYADARARQGPPAVRAAALTLLADHGRSARVLEILFAAEFGDWNEDIYNDVLPDIPVALLVPHTDTLRRKFDATESLLLRSGIVECLRRVGQPQWVELAQAELNRAMAELRAAPLFPMRNRETPEPPSMRAVAHYTHMLWRTHKEWMAAWLVDNFGENLPEPLSRRLEDFPEDALVTIANRIVAATGTDYRGSSTIERLLASGSLRVARIFIDAYVAAILAGRDPLNLPRTGELRRQSPAVAHILVDALLAKAEAVDDFPHLKALISAISPVSPLDGSLGEQIEPRQRDGLRRLVKRTFEAIPTDDEARYYRPTLAVLLGSLGAPEDVALVSQWVADENTRWDEHRRRVAEAAAARPPRRVQHYGTSHWNWYAGALALFRCPEAEAEFLRWLEHPWLPAEGADGLVDLSLLDGSLPRLPESWPFGRNVPLPVRPLNDIRPAVRPRADAIVSAIDRIETLPDDAFPRRFLPEMVAALGRLHDPRAVDRLLALDGTKHGWTMLGAIACLQKRGMVLPGRRLAEALEPFIAENEPLTHGSNDQWHSAVKALRLLLFSDEPAVAIERMRLLPPARMNSYHAREVFALLAESPAPEAAALLVEYSDATPLRGGAFNELIEALSVSTNPRCHARLLELLHIPAEKLPGGNRSDLHRCILLAAERDHVFRLKLTEAIQRGSVPWTRPLHFGNIIGHAEHLDALLRQPDLGPVEQELRLLIESLSETHEPAGSQGSYYVFPADATAIKQQLAHLLRGGGQNGEVVSRLLAYLRLKRSERGQPANEPLHPDISMLETEAVSWPFNPS